MSDGKEFLGDWTIESVSRERVGLSVGQKFRFVRGNVPKSFTMESAGTVLLLDDWLVPFDHQDDNTLVRLFEIPKPKEQVRWTIRYQKDSHDKPQLIGTGVLVGPADPPKLARHHKPEEEAGRWVAGGG